MKATIITIGDELLIGQVIDTNSAWIAQQLNQLGIDIKQKSAISDNQADINIALQQNSMISDLVVVTGGLGPTKDDITKSVLCNYFEAKLEVSNEVLADIKGFLHQRNVEITELNRQQAEVPDKCTILRNKIGTAPGMWFEKQDTIYVFLPGVPWEMQAVIKEHVMPKLQKIMETRNRAIVHKTIHTTGIPESILAQKLIKWEGDLPENTQLAYLPSPGDNRLRITVKGTDKEQLDDILTTQIKKLTGLLPDAIFGFDNDTMQSVVGELLVQKNQTLASAESCTGGNIAHCITSVSGSSKYYIGSVVAYANRIKENILQVSKTDLQKYGAVSQQVVEQMALGVQKLFNTGYAVATSGIAGPEGGTPNKPVGTVWIAVVSPDKTVQSEKFSFGNERERNIIKATMTALNMLRLKLIKS